MAWLLASAVTSTCKKMNAHVNMLLALLLASLLVLLYFQGSSSAN
jgi:hypothetical protein